jgi:hypothetical protein
MDRLGTNDGTYGPGKIVARELEKLVIRALSAELRAGERKSARQDLQLRPRPPKGM